MSSTMTLTLAPADSPSALTACPNCGSSVLADGAGHTAQDAQKQIEDLQEQVRMLTAKATAAVDRWADYEDEITKLKEERENYAAAAALAASAPPSATDINNSNHHHSTSSASSSYQSRLSSFLSARKSTPNLQTSGSPAPPAPSTTDLVAALTREQTLRQEAEGKLENASGELEELSAQLFQQANEMVATERKARAKLEERVEVLERRDVEKRKRLERLEGAMGRIERVRGMLNADR